MSEQNKKTKNITEGIDAMDAHDPMALAKIYSEVSQRAAQLVSNTIKAQSQKGNVSLNCITDDLGVARAFMDLSARLLSDPYKLVQMQMGMLWDYFSLWQSSTLRAIGLDTKPAVAPQKGDKRFRDEAWESYFVFDFIKQSYLMSARHINETVTNVANLDEDAQRKIDFFTRQYVDALSPSNFILTNPTVLQETMRTNGQNLLHGLNNLLQDLDEETGQLRIRMTDTDAFKMGQDIASTPGKVVFQNELFQLIQYEPTTEKVSKRPLLIVPPWINKYYILDLREKNSFVKWSTDQGHSTFIISWVNPDEKLADKTFEDYLTQGTLEAIKQVTAITGEQEINTAGYCLGGTLLMTTLAYLADKKDNSIASSVFFTTLLDFSEPGELGVFLDEASICGLEKKMDEQGYLEGSDMAQTFNMLRSNDLIWSFVVNNYLLGKAPFPFDLLYWNSDSTRMPAAMHSYYLRNMYLNNLLREPGGLTVDGVQIDIGKVNTPCYFVSAIEDHIAPWKSTYKGALLPSGPVRFVLGGSGHIAGIINPPAAEKYGFWLNDHNNQGGKLPKTSDDFLATATQYPGSWWTDWHSWVTTQPGGDAQVIARKPGTNAQGKKVKIIEDAPGSYVSFRLDTQKKEKDLKTAA